MTGGFEGKEVTEEFSINKAKRFLGTSFSNKVDQTDMSYLRIPNFVLD